MREGIKLVIIGIMLTLIFVYAILFVFSERLTGTNDNILKPTEEKTADSVEGTFCKMIHGNKAFLYKTGKTTGCDVEPNCPDGSDRAVGQELSNTSICSDISYSETEEEQCCCKCKEG